MLGLENIVADAKLRGLPDPRPSRSCAFQWIGLEALNGEVNNESV